MKILLCCGFIAWNASADCINLKPGETDTAQKIINNAIIATVQIIVTTRDSGEHIGTGFLVGREGHVLTNFHVVRGATSIRMRHYSGSKRYAEDRIRVVAIDHFKDLALLRITGIKYSNGIGSLDLVGCSDKVTKHVRYILVANSNDFRNFVTEGRLGNVDLITQFLPDRATLDYEGAANPYKYPILLFHNQVVRGNSGAVVLNAENGKLIGVLAGAFGEDEYASFAIPVEYALRLYSEHSAEPGFEAASFIEQALTAVDENDPYYQRVAAYVADTYKDLVSVSGNVVEFYTGQTISNARVSIFEESMDVAFSQVTDENGNYGFQVPRSPQHNWKMQVSHAQYQPTETGPIEIGALDTLSIHRNHGMMIKPDYWTEGRWFYVNPMTVDLNLSSEFVTINHEYTSLGVPGRKSLPSRWSLCREGEPCDKKQLNDWLKANKVSGDITETSGGLLQLQYSNPEVDTASNLFDDILVYSTEENRSARIGVFAHQQEAGLSFIQGFVTLQAGGAPKPHIVAVSAQLKKENTTQSGMVWPIDIDETGYFRMRLPTASPTSQDQLHLEVTSGMYKDVNPAGLTIDLANPPNQPLAFKVILK